MQSQLTTHLAQGWQPATFLTGSSDKAVWLEKGGAYKAIYSSYWSSVQSQLQTELALGWQPAAFLTGSFDKAVWLKKACP